MENHNVPQLEGNIRNLLKLLDGLTVLADLGELLRQIHSPGYTTPAEFLFVSGIVAEMSQQVGALTRLNQMVKAGSIAILKK